MRWCSHQPHGRCELYRETYDEAQRIIRVSDEVRIRLEKVEKEEPGELGKSDSSCENSGNNSSSKLSRSHTAVPVEQGGSCMPFAAASRKLTTPPEAGPAFGGAQPHLRLAGGTNRPCPACVSHKLIQPWTEMLQVLVRVLSLYYHLTPGGAID
jgi:hypothetical protein